MYVFQWRLYDNLYIMFNDLSCYFMLALQALNVHRTYWLCKDLIRLFFQGVTLRRGSSLYLNINCYIMT